jgi:hypothetical protein
VLAVDDNDFNTMTIRVIMLDKFGFEPDEACDGDVAVEMFKKGLEKPCGCPNRAYKLIFMDL